MTSEEIVKKILKEIRTFNIDDLPNIDLYMDQVTTYLNQKFSVTKRHEDDKLMTKTMINNYAKSRLLPPPEKKKYTKDHIIVLIMIYFFKNVISMSDVTKILTPLLKDHFHNEDLPLENIINEFLKYTASSDFSMPIITESEESLKRFADTPIKDNDYLQTFGLITTLCYDMYIRKILVEKLIDSLPEYTSEEKD